MTCDMPDTDGQSGTLKWSEMLVDMGDLAKAGLHPALAGLPVPQRRVVALDLPDRIAVLADAVERIVSAELTHLYLPTLWTGACDADALRATVLAILSRDPDLRICFVGTDPQWTQPILALSRLWPQNVVVLTHTMGEPVEHIGDPRPGAQAPAALDARVPDRVRAVLDAQSEPESGERIVARLGHLRRTGLAPATDIHVLEDAAAPIRSRDRAFMRLAHQVMRALVPVDGVTGDLGLHLGAGVALGIDVGTHQLRIVPDAVRPPGAAQVLARVALNIRTGKVLKHEHISGITATPPEASKAEPALSVRAARVLGHDARALWLAAESADLSIGSFLFNEAWQFVGVVRAVHSVLHQGRVLRVLEAVRTSAVWDDLVAMADLGCARSADALAALGGLGSDTAKRAIDLPAVSRARVSQD
ncbi:MAG: hypothetical protein AAFO93_07900 [Pseudomonadota bacterium]